MSDAPPEQEPADTQPPLLELAEPTPIELRAALAARLRRPRLAPLLGALRLFDRAASEMEEEAIPLTPHHLTSLAWVCVGDRFEPELSRAHIAARAIFAALQVRDRIVDSDWQQESEGEPLETDSYRNFFSTALVPFSRKLAVKRMSQSRHVVLLIAGRAFRLDLERRGVPVTLGQLVGAIEACERDHGRADPAPCEASAGSMEEYGEAYELLATSPTNLASLRTLDAALLVVCLEHKAPPTTYETGRAAQTGSPHNRWFASALQLVVFADGKLAFIGSPTLGLEGTQAITFLDLFGDAFAALSKRQVVSSPWNGLMPLTWSYAASVLRDPRRSFAERHSVDRGLLFDIEFGQAQARRLGLPAAAAFHLIVQAATQRVLGPGRSFAQMQLVSMRHSTRGGLERHPTVTPRSLDFCASLAEKRGAPATLQAMRLAADDYRRALFALKNGMVVRYPDARTLLGRAGRRVVDRLYRPHASSRWSLLPQSRRFTLFGRFGIWPALDEMWAHAFLGDTRTTILANAPPGLPVGLHAFRAALGAVVVEVSALDPAIVAAGLEDAKPIS